MSNLIRLQMDLPEKRVQELENLMAECGIATKKDLFNTALTLFEWAVSERRRGPIIASVDEKNSKYKELQMPAFAALDRRTVSAFG